jgi:succinate-acetate transporter protein
MENSSQTISIKDTWANPGPIGLFGFALTTILLNIHNAMPAAFPLDSIILAMGICYGGLAQVIAGILEFKKGNTFGTFAFISYGFFWLCFVLMKLMPAWGWVAAPSATAAGIWLVLWGLLSCVLFVYTLRTNFISKAVFGTLVILFFSLAIADFTGSEAIRTFAGYEGILCGLLAAIDGAMAILKK